MGTQLSYGGSNSAPWDNAATDAAALDVAASSAEKGAPVPTAPALDSNLSALVAHIVQALDAHQRKPIPGSTPHHTPTSVRPSGYVPGTRSVRSGTGKFIGTSRSARSTSQSVARGAAAVSAGAALARRDRAALLELGLDLDDLATLSPREQQQRILDELLGAPGHPDDEALRRAAHGTLKAIALDPQMPQDAQIDHLLASYVYEQALVELTSSRKQRFSKDALRTLESELKPYIFKKARHQVATNSKHLSPARFMEKATSMSRVVLDAIRAYDGVAS